MSASNEDVLAELRKLSERFGRLELRMASLETSVTGLETYVRDVVTGDHLDVDHAEQREADALDIAAELEAEKVAQLEKHERKAKGGE
jgi:hypothetical protein